MPKVPLMINVCSFKDTVPKGAVVVDTTSRSGNWSVGLSPFKLGPVEIAPGLFAKNVENAWQYSKVYEEYVDIRGNPTDEWTTWSMQGYMNPQAVRYPMGKGRKPLYLYWHGKKLSYIEARRKVYAPLYALAVEDSLAYTRLEIMLGENNGLWLWDFDGYDYRKLKMSLRDVLYCEHRKMGHAFVLAMMLLGKREWENGTPNN